MQQESSFKMFAAVVSYSDGDFICNSSLFALKYLSWVSERINEDLVLRK